MSSEQEFQKAYSRMNPDEVDTVDTVDAVSLKLPEAHKFPTEALPRPCANLVREAAAAIGCPPELVALPMLVTLGSAIGNARRVVVKSGWEESAALFGAIVAPPGAKKTPATTEATRPAFKAQIDLKHKYAADADEYEREQREYEVERKEAARNGLAAPPPPRPPGMGRTLVADTTIEALVDVLSDNPRGILVERDELAGWVRGMDQYRAGGKGSDRQHWLSIWSGKPITVDRRMRQKTLIVNRPFTGIIGGIQPRVLGDLADRRDDGLVDRFLYAYPEPVRSRWTDDEITETARNNYRWLYDRLRDLHMELDDHGDPEPARVMLSPQAKEILADEINAHNAGVEAPGFPSYLEGPWAKMEGYLCRLALILAVCRSVIDQTPERIEAQDVFAARVLIGYFKNHARRVYADMLGQNPRDVLTADLVAFLTDRGGAYHDEPATLYEELTSRAKPGRPDELSKMIRAIAKRHDAPFTLEAKNVKRDEQSRRAIKLVLENGVNGVNGVNRGREGGAV